ncbi:MAG: sulfotransferase domain-containing protein, partial [Armatimonadota bacterium]
MQKLDFLIIGAQKSGTTSLFKYLSDHPQIYLPREKEIPFFSDDATYSAGWDAYFDTYLYGAKSQQLIGTATPQYMCDPLAATRIHTTVPGCKLIAILRHPIERAISHHKMWVRRGEEKKSVRHALEVCLDPHHICKARTLRATSEAELLCYLAWSEYGRILTPYFSLFPPENILI